MIQKTTYKEVQDLMASIVSLEMNAFQMWKAGKMSHEKIQAMINMTDITLTKCENIFRGKME